MAQLVMVTGTLFSLMLAFSSEAAVAAAPNPAVGFWILQDGRLQYPSAEGPKRGTLDPELLQPISPLLAAIKDLGFDAISVPALIIESSGLVIKLNPINMPSSIPDFGKVITRSRITPGKIGDSQFMIDQHKDRLIVYNTEGEYRSTLIYERGDAAKIKQQYQLNLRLEKLIREAVSSVRAALVLGPYHRTAVHLDGRDGNLAALQGLIKARGELPPIPASFQTDPNGLITMTDSSGSVSVGKYSLGVTNDLYLSVSQLIDARSEKSTGTTFEAVISAVPAKGLVFWYYFYLDKARQNRTARVTFSLQKN
jgi:hypothetical protein